MKRDLLPFVIVLFLVVFVWAAAWVIPARAESRLYPYAGLVYHAESGLTPRPWLEAGTSVSLGRFAPSITGQFALAGQSAVAVDFRVRVKLGH